MSKKTPTECDDLKARIAAIRKLLDTYGDLHEKEQALIAEMQMIVAGKPMMRDRLNDLRRAFGTAWSGRYAGPYGWQFARDDAVAKRLLQRYDDDELGRRIFRYIQDGEAFLVKNGHTFGMFSSTINRWADLTNRFALESAPVDCHHVPPCQSDSEHTQRKMRETHA